MSLQTLAKNLQGEAAGGKINVSLATLRVAGLQPRPDIDTVIDDAFGWAAGTPLTLSDPLNVGNVSVGEGGVESLTVTGTLATLNVSGVATIQFTAKGAALSFTVALPLGAWSFTKSFPVMAGFPFKELELQGPSFIFSSDGASVPYGGQSIEVPSGLSLAGDLEFPAAFASLLSLLSSSPSQPLLMRGPVDPSVMVKEKLPKPDLSLTAPLTSGPLPKLGFLQLEDADLLVQATTEETLNGKAQYTEVALSSKLDFGEGEPTLECRVSLQSEGRLLNLLLQPAEGAKQPTLDALFRAMGGRSWYDVVPGPLQSLFTSFELKGLRSAIAVVEGKPTLASVGMSIGTVRTYEPFEELTIGELDFGWEVDDPLGDPAVSAQFTGECKFLPKLFPGVFYVTITSELEITAEYDGHATLSGLLSGGSSVAAAAQPFDFELESVVVDFDVPREAFSVTADAAGSLDAFGDGTLKVQEIRLAFARAVKQQSTAEVDASLNAVAMLGEVPLFLDAEYKEGGWRFAGGVVPGGSVPLGRLVEQICKGLDLPTEFVPSGLELTPLDLSLQIPGGGKPPSWTIHAGAKWVFSIGALQKMEIDARLDLEHGTKSGEGGQPQYSGQLSGEAKLPLPFGTVDVVLAYQFKPGSKDLLVEWKGFASANYSFTEETITFKLQVRSLGDMLAEIVRVVESEPNFQLPPPWDLLNQIVLRDFEVIWRLKPAQGQSAISLKYNLAGNEIKLFFVDIRAITLSEVEGKVMVGLDLKFITDSEFKEEQWPAQNPTPPPTGETSLFELELLALGQHVTVAGLAQQTDVGSAVALLQSFKPSDGSSLPVKPEPAPGEPVYAPESRWLVGTAFKVLVEKKEGKEIALLEIDAIFNDPQFYGLKIVLGGAKAGVFGGLHFEILYRKVSETVGVYEIELTLPEWARHLEFGEVSVTLPVVGIQVYTNGNFRIDFGFPANMNFSRSFAIQAFPFTGAGGFYFGVLSNETATSLPKTTKGTFNPVIVFGIGLQIGLGKSIEEGIFSAQLTVSVFGIVEGVVAPWHPNGSTSRALPESRSATLARTGSRALTSESQPFDEEYYYWLQGTVGIVGKLVGSVNFAIISASVNVTVQAFVQMTIEAHRAIPVHLEAGVSVEITLKIDLGLFSIKIHLSFSVTVKADFQIGSDSKAPWDPEGLAAASAAAVLAQPRSMVELPLRAFSPLAGEEKLPLTVYAAPHLTLADWTQGAPQAAYVVSLFLEGPIGRPPGEGPSDFEVLARETLLWVIANFGAENPESQTPAQAAEADVSAGQIEKALQHFTATGPPPLEYGELRGFLSSRFALTVKQPAAGSELPSAVAMPMLPDLVLEVPAWGKQTERKIDFLHAGLCTPEYLQALQERLSKLAVDLETPLQKQYAGAPTAKRPGAPGTQSLASFVFEDMFALMCRHMLQAAADSFANFPYALAGKESLEEIAKAFASANEVTAAKIGQANAGLALTAGRPLSLSSVQHQVKAGESLNGIAGAYGAGMPLALAQANEGREGLLLEGTEIAIGSTRYTIGGRDTFASIVQSTKAPLSEVVAAIGPLTDVLRPLALLAIPTFTYQTVEKDTLSTIAGAFGVPVEQLASENQGVASLFATQEGKTTFVLVKELEVLSVEALRETLHDANVYANLAGIATRFLLNGLRLPVGPGITLPPGSACEGCTECGLQSLTGQQVTLPPLSPSESFTLTLSPGEQGKWIQFASGSSIGLPIDNQASAKGTGQIDWINQVLSAAGAALTPKTGSIAALPDTRGVARRFSLPNATPLQTAAPLTLPAGSASAAPTILALPDGMLAVLAEPKSVTPAFSLQLAEPARSGGGVTLRPAQSYGWATIVGMSVKRPAPGQTPMSPGTYELVGSDPKGILLLERMLQAGAQPCAFHLLFAPNASAPASAGLQLEDPATVSTFIVKSNLSTATAPQGVAAEREASLAAGATPTPITPTAVSFAQLLWECSIVRSGGFCLYYETAPGSPGLPEHIFDATGTAQLQLLLIHPDQEGLGSYVNAALLGDSIDPTQTSVLAQSQTRRATIPAAQEATLGALAEGLHLTVGELAVELAGQPLKQGASVQAAGGVYETVWGDTLAALAKRFATTGAQIEAANAELKLDWSAIPAWSVLRLPATSVTIEDSTTTLAALAERLGLSVAALGVLNATTPLLPQGEITVQDEIVDSTAVLPPGIGGFEVSRTQLSGEPSQPSVYLDGTFHLLGYRLAENLGFKGGPFGLPVGPGEPLEEQQLQQIAPDAPSPAEGAGGTLLYEQLLPLASSAKANRLAPVEGPAPDPEANPYAGIGEIAQVQLEWRDLFGNRARTPLSEPKIEPKQPANLPPIPVQYTDALLGAGQWPSVRVGYGLQAGSPPSLRIELQFDPAQYAGASTPGPAQQAALADRQTFARAYYQLAQVHADGTPHVSIAVASSLDQEAQHLLAGQNDAEVRGLALKAWRYLDGLLKGTVQPRTEPILATASLPLAATNPAEIFELTVSLAFTRDPALVADASREQDGVAEVTLALSPVLAKFASSTETASIAMFADEFEKAYSTEAAALKLALGDSREGAAGSAEERLLWAVRTSGSPRQGAIGCEIAGPPVYWAPPPLSRVPVSRSEVEIWPFSPEKGLEPEAPEYKTFAGVDLDVWARQALAAVDALLSPSYDVPAFVLDSRAGTQYLERVRAAKEELAKAIAGTVEAVLEDPAPPTEAAAIADAREKWEQQLLIALSSAYSVDVAVQVPVNVSCSGDGQYGAPALYGHPILGTPQGTQGDRAPAPPYSLSTFKIPAVQGPSHLTFLFTANDPGDRARAILDLGYQVDHIEHQIGEVQGISGYKASTWLSFPNALPVLPLRESKLATLEVPIVLRAYPEAPSLTAQRLQQTLDQSNARTLMKSATSWTYIAQYAEQHMAQDVTNATATFNLQPPSLRSEAVQKDLFPPLARLISAMPQIQTAFDEDLSQIATSTAPESPQFKSAERALSAFTKLVEEVAENWSPVPATASMKALAGGQELSFTIAESPYPPPSEQEPEGGEDLLVTIKRDPSTPLPPGVPMPVLVFEGWEPVATGEGVRYQDPTTKAFMRWEAARSTPGRTVAIGPLEVLRIENAQMGVKLVRNAELVPGNPTREPFVYRTPLVTFTSPYTPLLSVAEEIDVAAVSTGDPVARPLAQQLEAMLAAFFAAAPAGTEETIQLQVGYRYEIASGLPEESLPAIEVPIALIPSASFLVPEEWPKELVCQVPATDGSPFACRVAEVIREWVKVNQPTPEATLTFDLAAFSTLSSATLPLVRLSGLVLQRKDVTDL